MLTKPVLSPFVLTPSYDKPDVATIMPILMPIYAEEYLTYYVKQLGVAQPARTQAQFVKILNERIADGQYKQATIMLETSPQQLFSDSRLNNIRMLLAYRAKDYRKAGLLYRYITPEYTLVAVDSLLNASLSDMRLAILAKPLIERIKNNEDKRFVQNKYYIVNGEYKRLGGSLSEEKQLELLNFYVLSCFPVLDERVMERLISNNKNLVRYQRVYKAFSLLYLGDYDNASKLFNKVDDTLYGGIASLYAGDNKSQQSLAVLANNSTDRDLIMLARYALAETRYVNGSNENALQLIDGCKKYYCAELRSRLYLANRDYELASKTTGNSKTDAAWLIRAAVHYNQRKYQLAKDELAKLKGASIDKERLQILISIKEKDVSTAIERLGTFNGNERVLYETVLTLADGGHYKQALEVLDASKQTSENVLLMANILAMSGNNEGAKQMFERLQDNATTRYIALYGQIAIAKDAKERNERMLATLRTLENSDISFSQKDKLLYEIVRQLLANKDWNELVRAINLFFANFNESSYMAEMYVARAQLFRRGNRRAECLADVSRAIAMDASLKKSINGQSICER
ncbi:hypothetical protein AGMMS49941_06010 [Deferribacterales bacterium]|nr:hypothetical protein AGMMS49941_06010 [Deferribacterales bacterium]